MEYRYSLRGVTSVILNKGTGGQPDNISVIDVLPLRRLVEHGVSGEQLCHLDEELRRSGLKGVEGTTWLLNPDDAQHGRWLMDYLPSQIKLMRSMVSNLGGTNQQHLNRLDPTQLRGVFTRLISQQDGDLPFHGKLHSYLTGTKNLPFADLDNTLGLMRYLVEQGILQQESCSPEQTVWRVAGSTEPILLGGRMGQKIILDRGSMTAALVQGETLEVSKFTHTAEIQKWLQEKLDWPTSNPPVDRPGMWPSRIEMGRKGVFLPHLGGIGSLHDWKALIIAPDAAAEKEDLETLTAQAQAQQPVQAWMPGMCAALALPVEQEGGDPSPVALYNSMRLLQTGCLVHSGMQPQPSRILGKQSSVRLVRPCNPFCAPPAAMSAR